MFSLELLLVAFSGVPTTQRVSLILGKEREEDHRHRKEQKCLLEALLHFLHADADLVLYSSGSSRKMEEEN